MIARTARRTAARGFLEEFGGASGYGGRPDAGGSSIIQADQFGTSIAKTLRVYSETLRVQRRQQVEEMAAKIAVKLVFPLVLFIFPSIFVVALGPSILAI